MGKASAGIRLSGTVFGLSLIVTGPQYIGRRAMSCPYRFPDDASNNVRGGPNCLPKMSVLGNAGSVPFSLRILRPGNWGELERFGDAYLRSSQSKHCRSGRWLVPAS